MTNEEIQQQYTAALSSVKLIDAILLKAQLNASDIARLTANAGHLTDTAAKEGMPDTTVLTVAAARANAAVLAFDKTGTVAQIVSAVNTQALSERDAALAAKTAAETALAAANTAHTAELAVAQAQITALQVQIDAYAPPVTAASITMRQARLALLGAGLLPQVQAALEALPSPQKEAAMIEWEYSQTVDRTYGLVPALATALDLSEEQLDALFTTAKGL